MTEDEAKALLGRCPVLTDDRSGFYDMHSPHGAPGWWLFTLSAWPSEDDDNVFYLSFMPSHGAPLDPVMQAMLRTAGWAPDGGVVRRDWVISEVDDDALLALLTELKDYWETVYGSREAGKAAFP